LKVEALKILPSPGKSAGPSGEVATLHWPSPWPCVLYSASATRYFLLLVVESVEEFLARMNPEILKIATELAKATGTAAGLSIPFTGIVKRMLGPAADELAEM
jgi:hypothetical protein